MREPNSHLAQARERKEAFLPEIARLSLEGHTSREVGEKVGIPKTTVLRWRNSLRRECASRSVKETMEMIDKLNERFDTIYRKALAGLDRSRADEEIRTINAYRNLFPDCRLSDRWVRRAARVEARRTLNLFEIQGHRGGLRSAGVGKSIAGKRKSDKRPRLLGDRLPGRGQGQTALRRRDFGPHRVGPHGRRPPYLSAA